MQPREEVILANLRDELFTDYLLLKRAGCERVSKIVLAAYHTLVERDAIERKREGRVEYDRKRYAKKKASKKVSTG